MQKSIVDFFIENLELKKFPKNDRIRILKEVLNYVMGLEKYIDVKNRLKRRDKKLGSMFLNTLKKLSRDEVIYIKHLRSYAVTFDEELDLFKKDKLWVCKFVNKCNFFIDVSEYDFLLEEDILKEMYPSIFKTSINLKRSLMYDQSLSIKDIINILYIKTIETYRIYICGCGDSFNDKMLYSCIHKGVRTKHLDILKKYNTEKAEILKRSIPIDSIDYQI